MKKILITLILVICIIFSSCGPGTGSSYTFTTINELIEILDSRFMFPTYYPDGFDPDTVDKSHIKMYGTFAEFGVENQKVLYENFYCIHYEIENKENNDFYSIMNLTLLFFNSECTVYEHYMYIMLKLSTEIRYHNNNKIYIYEHISTIEPYDKQLNQTIIYSTYTFFIQNIPYQFSFNVIINTTNEERVAALLPEINEMTYTEAMKMFDSLQPIE